MCGNYTQRRIDTVGKKEDYVLFLGRLSPEKGLWTLLRAFESLEAIKLKIAGTGPLEKTLRRYVDKKTLRQVSFTGFIDGPQKEECIQKALAVVVPSEYYKLCPISVLEAMAFGTCVLASRIGGLPELVAEGQTGFTFTSGDASELRQCLETLANDRSRAERMGREAAAVAAERFSAARHYDLLLEIYREAVQVGE